MSEQLKVWQDRIRILKKPPWIFAPLSLVKTEVNTTWAEAMTARPVMGTDGLLTIALGEGPAYRVLPKITGFFGMKLWRPTTTLKVWPPLSRPSMTKHAGRAGLSTG